MCCPPGSSLFPYTTLFRSSRDERRRGELDAAVLGQQRARQPAGPQRPEVDAVLGAFDLPQRQDRKSTRLNSSHEWISYAVFCLKKKIDTYNSSEPLSHSRQ